MEKKIKIFFVFTIVFSVSLFGYTFFDEIFKVKAQEAGISQNLDEMIARRERQNSAVWGYQYLENPNTYIWQPETLMYTDQETGHEVWILVRSPDAESPWGGDVYSKEHGSNAWSFDGSRIGFFSLHRETANPEIGSCAVRWVVNTDGSGLKAVEGVTRGSMGSLAGFGWSHSENSYYATGAGCGKGSESAVYKVTFDENNTAREKLLLETSSIDSIRKVFIKESVSTNDKWLVLYGNSRDWPTPNNINSKGLYFVNLEGTPRVVNAWGIARGCGPAKDPYGNHEWSKEDHFHDAWSPGPNADYVIGHYPDSSVFWRLAREGTASDGGPKWEDWDGDSFGENEEIIPLSDGSGTPDNPYGLPYWGHPVFDRWGRYVLHGVYTDCPACPGTRITDLETKKMLPHYVMFYRKYDGQHHSWTGWTDYVVGTHPSDSPKNGGGSIWINKWNESYEKAIKIVNTNYPGYSGNYNGYPRPSQSPDGTKVAFSAVWLNNDGDDHPYIAYAVAYYPYPPTNLSASYSNGVKLSWQPPTYTTRGWPNEETDPPPPAREVKRYHIWRSTSQLGPWQEVGSVNVNYYKDDYYGPRQTLDSLTYTDNPGNGIFYYALTTEEHSGLESRELSEIIKVTVSGNNVDSKIVQQKGQKDFWTKAPLSPSNFSYQSTGTKGHYYLSWTEPNDSKIRYYNIYYSTSGNPAPVQQRRIASLPVGTNSWLDWNADPNKAGYYGITSVDRQGNESSIVYPGGGPVCGNGIIETGEECDDGNTISGDGCSSTCKLEGSGKTGDLDADNDVDIFDLLKLLSKWGTNDANADLNGSGNVDIFDLLILLQNWGR